MQVIRQYYDCVDRERVFAPRLAKCRAQFGDMVDERGGAEIRERDREKERTARYEVSSVSDHLGNVAGMDRSAIGVARANR
jgi:hypothetical protein